MFDLLTMGLLQGAFLSIVAIGIMIPFRLLNFPDLTIEASYPFGGALCGHLILNNICPIVATCLCCLAAGVIGICTAYIHKRFRINTLLAGIILSIMVYSINLRIMTKPNLSLFEKTTLFSSPLMSLPLKIILLLSLNVLILGGIYYFLMSEKGLRLRAVGFNPQFSQRQGIRTSLYTALGLFCASALGGGAAALLIQNQSYVDIGMGIGIIIHALASLLIGESLVGTYTLKRQLLAPLVGALVYQQIQGLVLLLGLSPSDLKFATGCLVLSIMGLSLRKSMRLS